jgi:ABC-type transport system involved in multi-copper enzyme maturation permease subunit
MPIYDQGYEVYAGERKSLNIRWLPLWREEILPYLKRRVFIFLLIIAVAPWFYGIFLTFAHTQFGDSEGVREFVKQLPKVDEELVSQLMLLPWNLFLLMVVSIWVGSGLVARDRKERTLEVYLSRAIGPVQYLWAKGAALMAFYMVFTLLPVLVLVVFHVGLSGDVGFLWTHSRVLWGTVLYSLLGPGILAVFLLALSSLSRSPRVVGIALVGLMFFGAGGADMLHLITKSHFATLLNFMLQLRLLGQHCLGVAPDRGVPLGYTAFFFSAVLLASLGILTLRFSKKGVLR